MVLPLLIRQVQIKETELLGRKIYVSRTGFLPHELHPDIDIHVVAAGSGFTKQEALFKTKMELIERYSWLTAYQRLLKKEIIWSRGSDFDTELVKELVEIYGFDESKVYPAIKMYNLEGDYRYFPANLVLYTQPWEEEVYLQNTTGWAAHFDTIDALYSAVMELIERDSGVRWWYLKLDPELVYIIDNDPYTIYLIKVPSIEGYTYIALTRREDLPGFITTLGTDMIEKNAMIKALMESTLREFTIEDAMFYFDRITSQESISGLEEVFAYYLKEDANKYIGDILSREDKILLHEGNFDFGYEPISREEKIAIVEKLFKKYDIWYRDFSHPAFDVVVVGTFTTKLVPLVNPFKLPNHPRLKPIVRKEFLPFA